MGFLRSKGIRPYIVRDIRAPDPQEDDSYIFRSDGPMSPIDYVNSDGMTVGDFVLHVDPAKGGYLAKHRFRSPEELSDWLVGNGFSSTVLADGIYASYGGPSAEYNRRDAENATEYHREWSMCNSYSVALHDDPELREAVGRPVRCELPDDIPEGATYMSCDGETCYFYGDNDLDYNIHQLYREYGRDPYVPHVGDRVKTPRFLTVTIAEVFPSYRDMVLAGFTEPTHFDGLFEVGGRHIGPNMMEFAASPCRR